MAQIECGRGHLYDPEKYAVCPYCNTHQQITVAAAALALMGWLAKYLMSGSMTMPFLRNGFRMVAFSLVIMIVVLFFRQGLMGDKELPDLFKRRRKEAHQ